MPSLRDTQAAFAASLLDAGGAGLHATIAHDGLAPAARLAIHRHHVRTTLRELLESVYPVVCRLVDRRFFGPAADRFVTTHPPAGPCLFEYGEGFAEFLAELPSCRELSYLPDVARLEWAMQRAMHADDAPPIDPRTLGAIDAEAIEAVTVTLHPSVTLLHSAWPIDKIWRANQPEAAATVISLDAGGAHLEVRRVDDDVVLATLAPSAYTWRRALQDGRSLGAAAAAARAVDASFDLAAAFHALFRDDVIVRFSLTTPTQEEDASCRPWQ